MNVLFYLLGVVTFPVDFFEHCQQMNDVEFGGNDLLQIYNVQQIKHRLNNSQLYVASTKTSGFTIEINNSDPSLVICGIRVQVGNFSMEKAPQFLEVFGRTVQLSMRRSGWYDVPFTREECLTADKKVIVFLGASSDPSNVTMVDSVKVYGKTKEAFGWPEDAMDEFLAPGKVYKSSLSHVLET